MSPPTASPRSMLRTAAIAAGRAVSCTGAVVLAYHDITVVARGYHVTARELGRHIELLRSSGLRIVPVSALIDALEAGEAVDGLAAVTFDDALLGVAELALPVLERLDAPATVFAVAERLGSEPDWTTGEQRTLTGRELADLATAPGITIGSHAATHRSLPGLDDSELDAELRGARATLAAVVGAPVDLLAYPFGHHDDRVRAAARTAGYRAGFTFLNGRIEPDQDRFRLPRFTMGPHHRRLRLAHHLARVPGSWPDTQRAVVP